MPEFYNWGEALGNAFATMMQIRQQQQRTVAMQIAAEAAARLRQQYAQMQLGRQEQPGLLTNQQLAEALARLLPMYGIGGGTAPVGMTPGLPGIGLAAPRLLPAKAAGGARMRKGNGQ